MKRTGTFTAMILMLAGSIWAESELGFEVSLDYVGKYIWSGQNLNDDGAFHPGFTVTYGNLSAGIWGSMDLTNIAQAGGEFTEIDYWADYSADICEGLGYSVGVINYQFPNTAFDETTEVYAGLSFDLPLNPTLTVYLDVDEAEGTYISFAVGHTFENIAQIVPDVPVSMEIGASYGWADADYNNFYWGVDESASNDLTFSVAFPFTLGKFTVSPNLHYVTLVDNKIENASGDGEYFYAGVSVGFSF